MPVGDNGTLVFPQTLPQMTITNNYHLYFLDRNATIDTLSVYGASVIGIFVLSLAIEMLHFLKWFAIVRKRITTNCLISLVVDLHKDQDEIKAAQRKIRLSVCERIIVTVIHFMAKALQLLIIYLIMATYNIGYIVTTSAGLMMGNLIFGLIKDSIVITRVKKEKKEIEGKRQQMAEVLKKRKSTLMFPGSGHGGPASSQTLDTERAALDTKA